MEDQTGQNKSTQTQATKAIKVLFMLLSLRLSAAANPHQLLNLIWMILSATMGEVINSTSAIHPQNTWWPDLEFDLCLLAAGSWDIGKWEIKMPSKPKCGAGTSRCNTQHPPLTQNLDAATTFNRQAYRKHPSKCAPEGDRTRRLSITAGGLTSFTVPLGDASQRGWSIGSPLFVVT